MNSIWDYELSSRANRQMERLSPADRVRIFEALDRMIATPFAGDVSKLKGRGNEFRLRVGRYRIIFQPVSADAIVYVTSVARRPDAYRD